LQNVKRNIATHETEMYRQEFDVIKRKLADAQHKISDRDILIHELETKIQSNELKLRELESLRRKAIDGDDRIREVETISRKLATVQQFLDTKDAQLREVENARRKLEESFKNTSHEKNQQINKLEHDLQNLGRKMVDYSKSLHERDLKIQNYETRLKQDSENRKILEQQKVDLQERERLISTMERDTKTLQQTLLEVNNVIQEQESRYLESQAILKQRDERIAELEQSIAQLRVDHEQQLVMTETQVHALEEKILEFKNIRKHNLDTAQVEENLKNEMKTVQLEWTQREEECTKQISTLEMQAEELQKQTIKMQSDIKQKEKLVQDTRNELELVRNDSKHTVEELTKKLDSLEKAKKEAHDQIIELELAIDSEKVNSGNLDRKRKQSEVELQKANFILAQEQERVSKLETQLQDAESELSVSKELTSDVQKNIKYLTSELDTAKESLREAEQNANRTKNEAKERSRKVEELNELVQEEQSRAKQLENRLFDANEKVKELTKKIVELEPIKIQLEKEVVALKSELDMVRYESNMKLKTSTNTIESLKSQLNDLEAEHERTINKLKEEKKSLKNTIRDLEAEVETLKQKDSKLEKAIALAEMEEKLSNEELLRKRIESQKKQLSAEVEELHEKLEELMEVREQLSTLKRNSETQINKLREDVLKEKEARAEAEEQVIKYQDLAKERETLLQIEKGKLEAVNKMRSKYENEIQNVDNEASLEREARESKRTDRDIRELQIQVQTEQRYRIDAEGRASQSEQESKRLQKKVDKQQQVIKMLESNQMPKKPVSEDDQIQALTNELAKKTQAMEALVTERNKLRETVKQSNSVLFEDQDQNDIQAENKRLTGIIKKYEEELTQLRKQVQKLQNGKIKRQKILQELEQEKQKMLIDHKNQLAVLSQSNGALSTQVRTLENTIRQYELELESIFAETASKNRPLKPTNISVPSLIKMREQIIELKNRNVELAKSIMDEKRAYMIKVDQLEKQYSTIKGEESKLRTEITTLLSLRQANEELKIKVGELTDTIASLKSNLQYMENEKSSVEKKLQTSALQQSSMQKDINRLAEEKKRKESALNRLELSKNAETERHKLELAQKDRHIDELRLQEEKITNTLKIRTTPSRSMNLSTLSKSSRASTPMNTSSQSGNVHKWSYQFGKSASTNTTPQSPTRHYYRSTSSASLGARSSDKYEFRTLSPPNSATLGKGKKHFKTKERNGPALTELDLMLSTNGERKQKELKMAKLHEEISAITSPISSPRESEINNV
jgi:chromosome segregation ATPase